LKRHIILWIIAVAITLLSVLFQRMTGPTYPLKGTSEIGGISVSYILNRSHGGFSDDTVKIKISDSAVSGILKWKRYKTPDEWTLVPMIYNDGYLTGILPYQPPAGKLIYRIELNYKEQTLTLPREEPVIIRFKGDVPMWILTLHVLFMFIGMLVSTRAGLECFSEKPLFKKLTWATAVSLFIGGLLLGPVVQWYAFGAWWTGWPFGSDMTDNKTLIAFIGWLAAVVAVHKSKKPERWVLAAAVILLIVYMIPHSMFGSELDYQTMELKK